jgi:hypothetical protein
LARVPLALSGDGFDMLGNCRYHEARVAGNISDVPAVDIAIRASCISDTTCAIKVMKSYPKPIAAAFAPVATSRATRPEASSRRRLMSGCKVRVYPGSCHTDFYTHRIARIFPHDITTPPCFRARIQESQFLNLFHLQRSPWLLFL